MTLLAASKVTLLAASKVTLMAESKVILLAASEVTLTFIGLMLDPCEEFEKMCIKIFITGN